MQIKIESMDLLFGEMKDVGQVRDFALNAPRPRPRSAELESQNNDASMCIGKCAQHKFW